MVADLADDTTGGLGLPGLGSLPGLSNTSAANSNASLSLGGVTIGGLQSSVPVVALGLVAAGAFLLVMKR